MACKIYKRPLQWWQEDGEQPVERRLTEGYYTGEAVKPGSDGRNLPSVTKSYVKKGGDGLGTEKLAVSEKAKLSKKNLKEEEDLEGMEVPEDADFNDEGDVPADIEDLGDVEGEAGEGDVSVDEIQICINGQTYDLVPAAIEGEDELADEGEFEDEGLEDGGEEFEDDGLDGEEIVEEKVLRRPTKKTMKEADLDYDADLYNWQDDAGEDIEAGILEQRKQRVKAIRERIRRANLRKQKEEIDTLGGKKLAMSTGKGIGAADFGLEGGFEFDAPRTQGSPNKATAYKPSSSQGKYGEAMKRAAALIAKREAEAARAAKKTMSEELDAFEQEDQMSKKDLEDLANLPYEIGSDAKTLESYKQIKARRQERAERVSESVVETASPLDFKKLLREGFGKDSRVD